MNDGKSFDFNFLNAPTPIREQNWAPNTRPFVSISTLTYNHENYIEHAIESFLMQKTTFPVKIVIFEDCSTDRTRKIVEEYKEKYPHLFALFLMPKNTYQTPQRREAKIPYEQERERAKYIAICEGDDYWTDPLKLQKQVNYLETNPDCSLCYHKTRVKMADGSREDYFFGAKNVEKPTKFTLVDFIKTNNAMGIRTVAMTFRAIDDQRKPAWFFKSPIGDLALQLYLGTKGKYGYLPEEMAVYNRGNPGAWSANNHSVDWRIKQVEQLNKVHTLFDKNTHGKYHQLIKERNKNWMTSRIKYVQTHFDRSDQFKIMRRYFLHILPVNKTNVLLWLQFLLGEKGMSRLIDLKHRID